MGVNDKKTMPIGSMNFQKNAFFFFWRNKHTHTQGREKEVLRPFTLGLRNAKCKEKLAFRPKGAQHPKL